MAPENSRDHLALEFLRLLRIGNGEAARRLVTPDARHHNPYFVAGMKQLIDAAVSAASSAPERTADVLRVVASGECVAVHSHVRHRSNEPGVSVVHIFRFEGELIAELWDVGQAVPADTLNSDGMF